MGRILPILDNLFPDVLKRLGIRQVAPTPDLFDFSTTILPVALVDSEVTLNALLTQTAESFATEGEKLNVADATLLADTGQLDMGKYRFRVYGSVRDGVNNTGIALQQRDPTNAANDWDFTWRGLAAIGRFDVYKEWTQNLDQNERVRVIQSGAGSASGYTNAVIWYVQLS